MIPRTPFHPLMPVAGTLLLALAALAAAPTPSPVREMSRDQQIADIERQIAELNRKLEALKKAPAPEPKPELALPADWVKAFNWRCIGPAAMGGRIVAFSVYEADPTTYWVATASGGLLKTSNNGTTFEHQFDREGSVSIGDVCVAPSDRNIVWVGTGENNPRNSVSYGDGVYKSTDGGKTWKNMGLKRSFQVGRIVVHPKDPNTVYVGALGRLYGPSEERGLYKTSDGGKTWKKILYIDENTGVIELKMHPTDPETLLVATWEVRRDGFDSHSGALANQTNPGVKLDQPLPDGYDPYDPAKKWGKGSGLWKTTDGGKNFTRLTKGLPSCALGRVGIDYSRKDPKVVFAVIDSEKIGTGPLPAYLGIQGQDAKPEGAKIDQVTANSPAAKAGLKAGDIVTAFDKKGVKGYDALVEMIASHKPDDKVSLSVTREGKPVTLPVTLGARAAPTGGGGAGGGGRRTVAAELTPADARSTELRVASVVKDSALDKAGLKPDDVIVSVNKKPMPSWRQFFETVRGVEEGQTYSIEVRRGKEVKALPVTVVRRVNSRPYGFYLGGQRENVTTQGPDASQTGGVYKSTDGGDSWTRINSLNPRPFYFSQVRVDPSDDKLIYVLGIRLHRSEDGGKTFRVGGDTGVHPDHHALWIDPRDGRHMLIGGDGGTYVTYDRGAHWDYLNTAAVGQFYHVCLDSRKPYRAYGGLQDNGSWGGPSRALDGRGPVNSDWVTVNGGDGFVCRVDPTDPDIVYFESQDGNIGRRNLRTGERSFIKPRNVPGQPPYRWNWNTPFVVSAHNPQIVYCAGNVVFRSVKRGDDFKPISPELPQDSRASATALSESPMNPDVLWAGTDDGQLWVTRDGGAKWTNVIDKVKLPRRFCVASIEPSRFAEGRAYVAFDGHRSDDDNPHAYVTEDYGQTWKSINADLPVGSTRVLREDISRPEVLYLGTEFACWASIDRGVSWTKINNNLPTVAVHELAQHPTAGEMVAATHGRSLWVLDVTPLRQMSAATRKQAATLFQPNTVVRYRSEPQRGSIYGAGARGYFGQNPPPGAQIYYALTKKATSVKLVVQDVTGKTVATLQTKNEPGLHVAPWNLQAPTGARPPGVLGVLPIRATGPAHAGQYRVVLTVDGQEQSQGLTLENDPNLPPGTVITGEDNWPARRREVKDD